MSSIWNVFLQPAATKSDKVINVGILGAANIAGMACLNPLSNLPNGKAYAIAARSIDRAREYARKNKIPVVHNTYEEVINDPNVHAVFIPLPNGLHAQWALASIKAGKHVLCEKPLTDNAKQAEDISVALDEYNLAHPGNYLIFAEAFHWKSHPLTAFIRDVILGRESGWDLGTVESVDTFMILPGFFFADTDIRLNFDLGGGTMMDCCYVVSTSRFVALTAAQALGHTDPIAASIPVVEKATPVKWATDERIDLSMEADLLYPTGIKSKVTAALKGRNTFSNYFTITGSKGTLTVNNFLAPYLWNSATLVRKDGTTVWKRVYGEDKQSTYWHQMKGFLQAIENKETNLESLGLTDIKDSIANMKTIDAIYEKCGMPSRP